jgi:hypothetical protein
MTTPRIPRAALQAAQTRLRASLSEYRKATHERGYQHGAAWAETSATFEELQSIARHEPEELPTEPQLSTINSTGGRDLGESTAPEPRRVYRIGLGLHLHVVALARATFITDNLEVELGWGVYPHEDGLEAFADGLRIGRHGGRTTLEFSSDIDRAENGCQIWLEKLGRLTRHHLSASNDRADASDKKLGARLTSERPFWQLMAACACQEGAAIGPKTARLLADDFVLYQVLIDQQLDEPFKGLYRYWRRACELAAMDGVICLIRT